MRTPTAVFWMAIMVGWVACAARAQAIVGDCDHSGSVTVNEVVIGVNIALDQLPLSACPAFDADGNGAVTVDELVLAVNDVLAGGGLVQAFVVATDFQTGSFGTITLDEPRMVVGSSPSRRINSDAVARAFDGLVFVVNRFGGDNIQVLDPAQGFATRSQCSTGTGSNPNDIAFASTSKAYVPLFASAQLLVVNPLPRADCTDFVLGHVDLSAYADADGIPDMSQATVVGDMAYVSLQRLTNFVPSALGLIVAIDTQTDAVVDTIQLSGQNPFAQTKGLTVRGDALIVAEVGVFGVNDGGIERVSLTSAQAEGFLITEAELGGDVTDFSLTSDTTGYAIVSKPDFTTALVAFDLSTHAVTRTLLSGGNFADIELNDRGELFLSDRSLSQPGIRIFRASDGVELTTAPINLGLPPFDIVFLP